jgi:serine/threonine protein phosphatase 1
VHLIVLGDFIDRGPESRKLIRSFMLAQQRNASLDVLLGNHEALLLDSLTGDEHAQKLWLKMGGLATLESFGIDPPDEDESPMSLAERLIDGIGADIIEWLRDLPVSLQSGDYLFCHAGVKPGVPLRNQKREDMLWIRKAFMESNRNHGAVIVHGHSIVEDVEVRRNRISLDTAAYSTGKLSSVRLDGTSRYFLST